MNQDMILMNTEAFQRTTEYKDRTDSCHEDHMSSFNVKYAKNSDYTARNHGSCSTGEHLAIIQVEQEMKVCFESVRDEAESYGQRGVVDFNASVDGRNSGTQYIGHEVLVNKRTPVSSLVDEIGIDTSRTKYETISRDEKCGENMVVELMSDGHLRKDSISSSHFRTVVNTSDMSVGLSSFSIHNEADEQVINKGDSICNTFNEPRNLLLGAVEGSGTDAENVHEARSLANAQHVYESNGYAFIQNNAENSKLDVAVNFTTMQQLGSDIRQISSKVDDRSMASSKANDSSEIFCYQDANFDGTHEYEQKKSEKLDRSCTSVLQTAQVTKFALQGLDLQDVNENAHQAVEEFELLSAPIQRTSSRAESPSKNSLKHTSSTETVCPQGCSVAGRSDSSTKENKAMLNFLKHDGAATSDQGSRTSSASPCKVVTKYVYIKSPKSKLGKKNLGVLYKQAFKHYYRAKLKKKKKQKPIVREKRNKIESTNKPVVTRKNKNADFINEENALRKTSREERNKSREERRLARELKKNASRDLNERKKQKKILKKRTKKKYNESERTTSKKTGTESSQKGKQKHNFPNTVCTRGKSSLTEHTGKSSNSHRKENVFCRKQAWKNVNKRQEVANKIQHGIISHSKKNKKHKKTLSENSDVEIKQEIAEEEIEENHDPSDDIVDPDTCSRQRKSKMRKDLTLQEKVQAIGALEMPGSKLVAVAKRFGVSVSAISRINKNKEIILLQSVSGDLNSTQRRSRECKDPELDKVLLRWYRAIENLHCGNTVVISNVLLKEKVHELAITMGKNYFPSDNWIIRWKNRHNIGIKSNSKTVMIQDREELKQLDGKVNISEVLEEMGKQEFKIDQVKRENMLRHGQKPEELFICEHCGVLTSTKKKKENNHLPGCPASSVRKDLTLEEKVQVVRALEQPGVKMVTLAKKYGVSASAVSRIHKNRLDILARRASGLANSARRRDRGSKEPEVEKMLCEWFKVQHELGIHISGSMIREKARDIAKVMGKDFWPSESWVFRWRHRNNVTDVNTFLYGDSDEGDLGGLERCNDNAEDVTFPTSSEDGLADKSAEGEEEVVAVANEGTQNKKRKENTTPDGLPAAKQFRLPRSVMCEKCGFVSCRVKNNRIKSLRHAKGCPDLKPRNELTYENRARMLKALEEPGATLSSVARQFGVSVSSMSRMNQKKDQILSHSEDHASQKRIRDCKEPEVAYSLYQWYMEKKAEGVHITGPKLKEKAKKLASELGREFNASSGWLGRWRHRYNIMSSLKNTERVSRDNVTKRRPRKDSENKVESSEQLAQLQAMNPELHQDSLGSTGSVIVEPLDPAPQPSQTAPIFIHQRFQNPWEINQQQAESCVWTKEFLTQAGPSVLDEAAVSVAYTYGDTVSKPVFHNMFDSFSAIGYQVAMPLDSSMILGREYLKSDINDDKCALTGGHLLPQSSHPSHSQHSHHLPTSQQHLQHHLTVTHPHNLSHCQQSQIQPHPQMTQPLPPPSAALDDDPEQLRQVMEAFKIMSSFAQKKSLGDQVQTALRTIEMSVKSTAGKITTRNTYTSM